MMSTIFTNRQGWLSIASTSLLACLVFGCATTPRTFRDSPSRLPPGQAGAVSETRAEPQKSAASASVLRLAAYAPQADPESEPTFTPQVQAPPAFEGPEDGSSSSSGAPPEDRGTSTAGGRQAAVAEVGNPNASNGATTQEDAPSYEFYVTQALTLHPKLVAARQRVAAAQLRVPQARALADPMLSETFWPFRGNALETAGGRAANQLTVSQAVPWPEKLSTKEAIACREVQIARSETRRLELEISEAVRLACFEVWFANRAIDILDESSRLVQDLVEISEARYQTGGRRQDVLRAQLEDDRLAERRVQLVQQKQVAQADLAALLHAPTLENLEVSPQLPYQDVQTRLDELLGLAEQCNPELRGLRWQIARDREKQRLACLQKYPDFQLGMSWLMITDQRAISPVATGNDNFGFTIGMTLPIWRQKIQAGIREASHQTASSVNLLQAERDSLAGRLRRLLAQVDALVEQRAIYRERIIPRTEDTLQIALADYRGGRTDFFSIVETYRELLMFELQVARLEATLAGTLAQIERLAGCPPEVSVASPS